MTPPDQGPTAFGHPGLEPRWTRSSKQGIGTAYSASSRVWFTLSEGVLNEVYYPTVDRPQIRDLQFLITDGESFFHEERRDTQSSTEYLSPDALGYRVVSSDPEGRYRLHKEIITDPHSDCVLIRTRLEAKPELRGRLRLFALLAPHLEMGGWGNSGLVTEVGGREILAATRGRTWLALGTTPPFAARSCGYVGASDGWTDLAENLRLDWQFARAPDGNIALTGEIDLAAGDEFTLGLAFGDTLHRCATALFQALAVPFDGLRDRYLEQWRRACDHLLPLERVTGDAGRLYHVSHSLLLAHEDKTYPGALIASLSIPWGEVRGDDNVGGYHLVWTRDAVNSALGLLAAGNLDTPLRTLIYLAVSQLPDGGFPQNFWLSGEPYWPGIQLDEVAFPVILAWRLHVAGALQDFDPYPMVLRAAGYLIRHGPATPQERWEENSGISPSTLAACIAALTGAAGFAHGRSDELTSRYIQEYADFLEGHIEQWTVTSEGSLLPEVRRHYIRILPTGEDAVYAGESPDSAELRLKNRQPGTPDTFPARAVVDPGFLELVRFGIRPADDPLIVASLRVVDALLRVETPAGSTWRRYNHDGYGQRADGSAYDGWGTGRPWPLLTGERGHYELAAGHGAAEMLRTMERLATETGLLTEQVWDEPDGPAVQMYLGQPTGAAMPLMWAHAEYLKLVRSAADGQVFDLIPEVRERYQGGQPRTRLVIWKESYQPQTVSPGVTLRIQAARNFELRWSADEWQSVAQTPATATALGVAYVDLPIAPEQRTPIRFTMYWTGSGQASGDWEGRDFAVGTDVG